MEKGKKWQLFLILAVLALTIYNIFPTVFYYCKPLRKPVDEVQGEKIAKAVAKRVDRLEGEALDWLSSFCQLIHVKPLYITPDKENPQFISVSFAKEEEAARFRRVLPRSGALIPFVPGQLSLASKEEGKEVLVQRRLSVRLGECEDLFSFVSLKDEGYRDLAIDRAAQVAFALAGPSESALFLSYLEQGGQPGPFLETLAGQINALAQVFGDDNPIGARFAARFTQGEFESRTQAVEALMRAFQHLRDGIKKEAKPELQLLENKIYRAESYLKKHVAQFANGRDPWSLAEIEAALKENSSLLFEGRSPLFSEIAIDFEGNQIVLKWHPDVLYFRSSGEQKNLFEQWIVDEVAKISRLSGETLSQEGREATIALTQQPNSSSFLVLHLDKVAKRVSEKLLGQLKSQWKARHPDLQGLLVVDAAGYQLLPPEKKALCLVVYSPVADGELFPNLRHQSIYVIAKGIDRILQNYQEYPDSELAHLFSDDFNELAGILRQNGFLGYHGSAYPGAFSLANDFLFEKSDYYSALLAASREDFALLGTKRFALLELADFEHRLLAENKIETRIHEDLLKWNDEYRAAQVSLNPAVKFDVPKPTRNIFWSNLALSCRKFFRGDDRKIIRWGLDLSGGKTVQIELRKQNGERVENDDDLKQGINELYRRVNKMGMSEVAIRQLGNHIVLDFPSSQALSACELIQSSTMQFHIVNEKFSPQSPSFGESVNRFLQEVWNQAVVLGTKDPQSIHRIAYEHLGSEDSHSRSEAAGVLWENGLRLAPPGHPFENRIDESLSRVAVLRASEHSEWHGQTHPLLIVFHNHALEGAFLKNIRAGYDPSKGNFLNFEVQGASAQNALHSWTSRFSKEKVAGTVNETYSRGHGWRMAVLLNDSIINAPTLESPLRDGGMISGSFSQREVGQLVADLKAGSLTFTPHILSEKNVSPELGKGDRIQGITATAVALFLVIAMMIACYRFAGVVASVAVIFNLLILWATLQNLGATLTLAGLAGVILTVGMAVDANVLVFERIKEEFAVSGRMGSAIAAGYKRAFSAIVDSNVTTIIAALILLNFDAGPIKSFAINLIIGIASSMFTALFATRYYFGKWVQNSANKTLKMATLFRKSNFNFLKWAKPAFVVVFAIAVGGGALIYAKRGSIFGMDFTGGYALNIEVPATENPSQAVEEALLRAGIDSRDFQIRSLNPSNHLRILLGTAMEQSGKPFYSLPIEVSDRSNLQYEYEKNPRIDWVVHALQSADISLSDATLAQLENHWTAMSGQMSDSMRNNALVGLLIAFVCIFIYLAFRFEYKFAAAALICLLHDVFVTVGVMGLLHALGVAIQIDLNTIAALMTIIGYSLNDTIIIFDRIREEMRLMKAKPFAEIVNHALNITLSRTTMTSGITLLVLLTLTVLGGASIFSFSLVMVIGVFFGTLSSWFIASPILLFFHKKEKKALNGQLDAIPVLQGRVK